jgi:hypothetical protein
MIRSKRIRLAWYVPRMGPKRNACRMLVGNQRGRDDYEAEDVGVWIISKWILEKGNEMVFTELTWFRIETSGTRS